MNKLILIILLLTCICINSWAEPYVYNLPSESNELIMENLEDDRIELSYEFPTEIYLPKKDYLGVDYIEDTEDWIIIHLKLKEAR